jgi:ribonucleoside-diphosphate reductase alpha subunit
MKVLKRDGHHEHISFDKVLQRIRKASKHLQVNPDRLTQQVLSQIYDGVKTEEIDDLTAQLAASLSTNHPDWATLASRIAISNHQKKTSNSFCKVILELANQINPKTGENICFIHQKIIDICNDSVKGKFVDDYIKYDRDYEFDFFGFKTLERAYLLKDANRNILERPQHLWMRVSLALWPDNLERAFETYDLLSLKKFTHATPTLFSAGTSREQLSSCFLIAMQDDSINGIFKTLSDCASISKYAGGIGLHIHNIRARGASIRGTNGVSDGLGPMLRVFNNTARYVNQGGRRNGSFAVYLEPWHADIEDFLKMKLPTGAEEERARDLFYALWIPDLFMKRVEEGGDWSLFCPDEAPGLSDVYGEEFEALYTKYEKEGRARKTLSAQKLWFQTLDAQMETGTPYLVYKDAANKKSNQQNIGIIKSSNLCSEIIQYSDANETAVCNLASLSLPAFVTENKFDFNELRRVTRVAIRNLNRVIDINFYPTPETKTSNMKHRPVGLGVQGLADVFALLKMDWEEKEAQELNQLIFEHMYYAAVDESSKIGLEEGSYESFIGSPANLGKLQPDLWGITPITEEMDELDWKNLRKRASVSLRNSLLIAPMPTASTSQILGNNECFEPFTSNLYTRRTLAGEFIIVNKYLLKELMDLGIWSDAVKQEMVAKNGSVQGIATIPEDIQKRYKTAWELKQRCLIDMSAARGAFVCQSQSLNLFVADATYSKLTSMHFHGWHKGLKTGCYYLRTKAPVMAQKFTVDPRFAASLQSSSSSSNVVEQEEKDDDSDSDSDVSDSDEEEKREKDAKSFKERMMAAKAATDAGGECLMCGS